MDEEIVQASTVLTAPTRLAHDGYKLTLADVEMNTRLGSVQLTVGAEILDQWPNVFTWTGETHAAEADADAAVINVMLEYLNSGNDPERLVELAEALAGLPQIRVKGYSLLAVNMRMEWNSYYKHLDGKCYQVTHGLAAEELTHERIDELLEEFDGEEEY